MLYTIFTIANAVSQKPSKAKWAPEQPWTANDTKMTLLVTVPLALGMATMIVLAACGVI